MALAIAGLYAFGSIFSDFAPYDDEGYLMLCWKQFFEGRTLYDQIFTPYGPAYYFYEWLLHRLAGVPLTHDTTRILCIAHWLTAAAILGFAARALTRSAGIGLLVFMEATIVLRCLTGSPGHPQELVAVLLAVAALVAASGSTSNRRLAMLGAIGAVLTMIKINVGVFFGAGLLLSLLCRARWFEKRTEFFLIPLVVASALPFVLMQLHLDQYWAEAYAASATLTILCAGFAAYFLTMKQTIGVRQVVQVGAGFTGITVIVLGVLLLCGSSSRGALECLVLSASKFPGMFVLPVWNPHSLVSAGAALLAMGLAISVRSRSRSLGWAMDGAKGLYGLVGVFIFTQNTTGQFALLMPWGWLVLLPRAGGPAENERQFGRTFLCLQAAWQSLQAYPVAGAQIGLASFLPVLIYAVCLHDGVTSLVRSPWWETRRRRLAPRTAGLLAALGATCLLTLFSLRWCELNSVLGVYRQLTPLNLRGARYLRLPPERVVTYTDVARYLEAHCDVFFTYPGMNSLYFWTGKPSPTDLMMEGQAIPLSETSQKELVASLAGKRALIVINESQANLVTRNRAPDMGPFVQFLNSDCHEVARSYPFRILAPTVTEHQQSSR